MYLWNKAWNNNRFPSWEVVIILVFATIYYILFNNLQHDIVYTSYLESSLSSHFHQFIFLIIAFFCPTILWEFITTKSKSWALHYALVSLESRCWGCVHDEHFVIFESTKQKLFKFKWIFSFKITNLIFNQSLFFHHIDLYVCHFTFQTITLNLNTWGRWI